MTTPYPHVAAARRADLCGTLAQEESRPLMCQNHLKISILKTEISMIERSLTRKSYGVTA